MKTPHLSGLDVVAEVLDDGRLVVLGAADRPDPSDSHNSGLAILGGRKNYIIKYFKLLTL